MIQKELEEQAYALLAQRNIQECINLLEAALRQIPSTPYHAVIGRDLLPLTDSAADYLQRFYDFASANLELKAIYLEMNGFAINPDLWFMDAFGYKTYSGLGDLDWLAEWDTPDFDSFTITGFEDIQKVYADIYLDQSQPESVQQAGELTEYLVTLRMQELVGAAHRKAAEYSNGLKNIVILSTSHDFDFISESSL